MGKIIVRIAVWILKYPRIRLEDRAILLNAILSNLSALPLHDIIVVNSEGSLVINGRALDFTEMGIIRESAKAALQSRALGLVRDQVLFQAFTFGVNKSINFEQTYFSKAAIWWGQQEYELLKLLAGDESERDLTP